MKTQTLTVQAIYDPHKNSIVYVENGKPKYGFVGNTANKKFIEAMADPNIELIIKDSSDMEKTQLIRQFHAILAKKGLLDIKCDIINQYNVESSKDLTIEQLKELIENLQKQDVPANVRQERSTVLALLDKLGVKGNKEIGWSHVNNYLKHPRLGGKTLYEMNHEELKAVNLKLRAIIHQKSTNNPKNK